MGTKWDIDGPAVGRVIERAAGKADGYEGDVTKVGEGFAELQGVLTNSQLVATRVDDFASEVVYDDLGTIQGHTASAIMGTTEAVGHYLDGHEQMAQTAQGNATKASYPTPPGVGSDGSGTS